ncbi:MAG: glucokinase, partial [Desulfobulbaceae bacterium]|nr:glucokinase [Desulfobulbaceae bacterium]
GTGLGEAMMFWDGQRYQAYPTEGGHGLFSPATRQQLALAEFLFARGSGAETFDLLASGRGLPVIYDFLKQEGAHPEPDWLAQSLEAAIDPAPVITSAALSPVQRDPLCCATLRLLVEIIAVESANLALKTLSTGGFFIGGGIPPKIIPAFQEVFMTSFVRPGPMQPLLAAMPVHLVTNPETALLGAARLAMGLT